MTGGRRSRRRRRSRESLFLLVAHPAKTRRRDKFPDVTYR